MREDWVRITEFLSGSMCTGVVRPFAVEAPHRSPTFACAYCSHPFRADGRGDCRQCGAPEPVADESARAQRWDRAALDAIKRANGT